MVLLKRLSEELTFASFSSPPSLSTFLGQIHINGPNFANSLGDLAVLLISSEQLNEFLCDKQVRSQRTAQITEIYNKLKYTKSEIYKI